MIGPRAFRRGGIAAILLSATALAGSGEALAQTIAQTIGQGGTGGASDVAPTLVGPAAAQGVAMLKLIVALGVVLLTFWVCARTFARFGRGRGTGTAGLEVLGSVALGQRERLVVVRAGGERLVLGVTAQTITPVHVMDRDEERDEAPVGAAPMAAASGASRGGVQRRPAGGAMADPLPSGPDFAARLRAALGRADA